MCFTIDNSDFPWSFLDIRATERITSRDASSYTSTLYKALYLQEIHKDGRLWRRNRETYLALLRRGQTVKVSFSIVSYVWISWVTLTMESRGCFGPFTNFTVYSMAWDHSLGYWFVVRASGDPGDWQFPTSTIYKKSGQLGWSLCGW